MGSRSANVVNLETDYQRVQRVRMATMPEAVQLAFDKSKSLLLVKLKTFFDLADDALFDTADKATSNQEQNFFFDAMRELRVQRRSIEMRFIESIESAYCALADTQNGAHQSSESDRPDVLSLVHSDELEEMLAVDSASARGDKQFGEAIQFISLRLDSLVAVKVYQKNNRISPDVLCKAFMAQVKRLEVTIQAKLILFRLFDKSIIQQLDDVYGAINQLLIDHNVMPSLPSSGGELIKRRSTDDGNSVHHNGVNLGRRERDRDEMLQSRQSNQATDFDQETMDPDVLSTLTQLLSENNSSGSEPVEAHVPPGDLIKILSKIQSQPIQQDQIRRSSEIRKLLDHIKSSVGLKRDFGRVDDEAMNLVNMLFDFILEDRNLAPAMKALISRMQIPMLKVAIVDKTFFTRGGHVARRLLNEIATSAIGWDCKEEEQQRDPFYKKVSEIVQKTQEEFKADMTLFADLLADFTQFMARERKRSAVLERRTIDAEAGKAKAELARENVDAVLSSRVESDELPAVVVTFIDRVWRNVLFVVALKEGVDSQAWKMSIRTMDELIWSVRKPETEKQRQTLMRLVPLLIKKLRIGLEGISYNPFEMTKLLKSLEELHFAAIRTRPEPDPRDGNDVSNLKAPQNVLATKEQADSMVSSETVTATPHDSLINIDELVVAHTKADAPANDEVNEADTEQVESLVRNDADVLVQNDVLVQDDVLAQDSRWMVQVSQFAQGSWFDMIDDQGVEKRCRLVAVIKSIGRYIFVNRNGVKVAERTQMELALALKNGQLSVLDNSMLFDRALETIVSGLRKPKP